MPKEKKNQSTEVLVNTDPQNASRRRAVKTIAGGVGALAAYHVLPVNWSRPIVEQVFLPAHAAVSGITLSNPCTVELVSGNQNSSIDVIRVSGFVTPPVGGLQVAIAALPNGGSGGQVDVYTTTGNDGTYSAEVTMTGGPGIIGVGVGTAVAGAGNISGCAVGIPPAQTPQPPSSTPTITVSGTPFNCGIDIPRGANNIVSNTYSAQITPAPVPPGQLVTVQFYLNNNLQITQSVSTNAAGSTFPATFNGALSAGTILTCRFTYAPNVSGECSNQII